MYDWTRDEDFDCIHDDFERDHNNDPFVPGEDNGDALEQWDHAAYDAQTGRGICTRNETQVRTKSNEIGDADWSDIGIHHGR